MFIRLYKTVFNETTAMKQCKIAYLNFVIFIVLARFHPFMFINVVTTFLLLPIIDLGDWLPKVGYWLPAYTGISGT